MLLGVQVDATGPLLDGHDGQAHVDAAVEFALLDLRQVSKIYLLYLIEALRIEGLRILGRPPCTVFYGLFPIASGLGLEKAEASALIIFICI